jgi:hypothetical protein
MQYQVAYRDNQLQKSQNNYDFFDSNDKSKNSQYVEYSRGKSTVPFLRKPSRNRKQINTCGEKYLVKRSENLIMKRSTSLSNKMKSRIYIMNVSVFSIGVLFTLIAFLRIPIVYISLIFPLVGTIVSMMMILFKGDTYDEK